MEATFLAVDLGAESGRVIAGQLLNEKVNLEEVARFKNPTTLIGDSLRWNFPVLMDSILEGLRKAKSIYADSIVSVGVDSWAVDYGLVDSQNQLLELPYHYRDQRTVGVSDKVWSHVSKEAIWDKTGIQFLPFNSLYQWYAHSGSTAFQTADHLLMIPDLIHLVLTGQRSSEYTNASTTQALNVHSKTWDLELLQDLDIRADHLPTIAKTPHSFPILDSLDLGRWQVNPPATHDTASAIVSIPGFERSTAAYISSGTWSLVGIETEKPILSEEALKANVTNEGGYEGTYRILKNVMGMWLVQGLFKESGVSSYEEFLSCLGSEPSFRFLMDPDHPSLLAPESMSVAIQKLVGASMNRAELLHCVLESLALKYAFVIRTLERLNQMDIKQVHVVGGGSRNDLLNQLTADACGVPVLAGPVEATAMGNILAQMHRYGAVDDLSQIRSISALSSEVRRYLPQPSSQWLDAKKRFEDLLQ